MKKLAVLMLIVATGLAAGTLAARNGMFTTLVAAPVAANAPSGIQTESNLAATPPLVDAVPTFAATPPPVESAVSASESVSVAQTITDLNAKAARSIPAGWVHIVQTQTFDIDQPNNGVLPNGAVIPLAQQMDIWYEVDAHGTILKTITLLRNAADGSIVQVGLSDGKMSWNSATDETSADTEQLRVDGFDGGFLDELRWLSSFGVQPKMTAIELPNGQAGLQIELRYDYDAPTETVDYQTAIVRTETIAVFDVTTGYLVTRQQINWFEDGSQRVFSTLTQTVNIGEIPDEEIMSYFGKIE